MCNSIANYSIARHPKTPKLSPMADKAITQGDIGGLGSLWGFCSWSKKFLLYLKTMDFCEFENFGAIS